jgi:hypothetical protein
MGFEPTSLAAGDFKSPVYTVPPHSQIHFEVQFLVIRTLDYPILTLATRLPSAFRPDLLDRKCRDFKLHFKMRTLSSPQLYLGF